MDYMYVTRSRCVNLVHLLPVTALDEAAESLTRILAYYSKTPPLTPPAQLAATRSVRARVSGRYTAPVYPIAED